MENLHLKKLYKSKITVKKCLFFVSFFFVFNITIFSNVVFAEGRTASIAFVNQGADLISDKGFLQEVESVGVNSSCSIAAFSALSYEQFKYKTNPKFDSNGLSFLAGLARNTDIRVAKFTTGIFFESGLDSYNTFDSFDRLASVSGKGCTEYMGGGLLGYFDFENNFYCEFSARTGIVTTYYDSISKEKCYDTEYFGAHAGLGYLYNICNNLSVNVYGKGLFTHENSKDIIFPTNESIKFADTDSKRVRVGANASHNINTDVDLYCGTAFEYELDGIINETTAIINIDDAQGLKGGSGIGEFGIKGSTDLCCADLGVKGYIGSREGFTVMLKVSFALFNFFDRFLGFSIDKFQNEKIGRADKTFSMSKKDCFNKCLDIIKELGARVTHKSFGKGYIVAFDFAKTFKDFCLDSTEAGIFITETKDGDVKVEVISNNSLLAHEFSVKLFEMLEQKTNGGI